MHTSTLTKKIMGKSKKVSKTRSVQKQFSCTSYSMKSLEKQTTKELENNLKMFKFQITKLGKEIKKTTSVLNQRRPDNKKKSIVIVYDQNQIQPRRMRHDTNEEDIGETIKCVVCGDVHYIPEDLLEGIDRHSDEYDNLLSNEFCVHKIRGMGHMGGACLGCVDTVMCKVRRETQDF